MAQLQPHIHNRSQCSSHALPTRDAPATCTDECNGGSQKAVRNPVDIALVEMVDINQSKIINQNPTKTCQRQ